jgi:PKD repeat protein
MWSNAQDACVQNGNSSPTAAISVPATATVGTPASFGATLSNDSSSAVSYAWSYWTPGGAYVSSVAGDANPQITFTSAGTYQLWVTVTDANGGTITGVGDVAVVSPPTAAFTWNPTSPVAGTSVRFSEGATAGSGSISSYSWSFGDGGTTSVADPLHTFRSAGTYIVSLTVTQSDGQTASIQHSIQVGSTAWLRHGLAVTTAQLKIPSLLRKNSVTTTVKSAVVSGKLVITWYATVKHRRVVIARGTRTVAAGVTAHISIRLTAAGRALLRKSKSVRVTVVGRYAFGTSSITSSRTLTLKR